MFKAYNIEIIFKLLAVREWFLFIFVTSWVILKLQVVWGWYEPQVTWGKNELLLKAQPKERWVHSLWNCSLAFSFTRRHGLRDIFTGIKLECSLLIPECSKKQKENHQEKKKIVLKRLSRSERPLGECGHSASRPRLPWALWFCQGPGLNNLEMDTMTLETLGLPILRRGLGSPSCVKNSFIFSGSHMELFSWCTGCMQEAVCGKWGGLCWSPSYCPPTPNSPFYPLLYGLQLRPISARSSVRLCHQGHEGKITGRRGKGPALSCASCPTWLLRRGIGSLLL